MTLRDIVKDAYREGGIIQRGSDPDATQLFEGLDKLKKIISSLYGSQAGSSFIDIVYQTPDTANEYLREHDLFAYVDSTYARNDFRLLMSVDAAQTVFLDPRPYDGARINVIDVLGNFATNNVVINGNGRKIEGSSSVTLNADNTNKTWFYRADLAEWVLINDLTEDSSSPFPSEFDDYLITKLAIRLNPRYLVQTAPETSKFYKDLERRFNARYQTHREMPSELALIRLTNKNYTRSHAGEPSLYFTYGLVI